MGGGACPTEFVSEWLLLAYLYLELINSWLCSKNKMLNYLTGTRIYIVHLILLHFFIMPDWNSDENILMM